MQLCKFENTIEEEKRDEGKNKRGEYSRDEINVLKGRDKCRN